MIELRDFALEGAVVLSHGTRVLAGSLHGLLPRAFTPRIWAQTFWPVGRGLRSKLLFVLVSPVFQTVAASLGLPIGAWCCDRSIPEQ